MMRFQQLLSKRLVRPLAEEERRLPLPYSRNLLHIGKVEAIACASVLATAISIGAWLSIRPHRQNHRSPSPSRPRQTVQMRSAVCTGIKIPADCEVPPGYTLIGLRRRNGDCFAIFQEHHTAGSPPRLPGGGV